MLRVGLTGGIAVGKSTVGQMFVELGCRVLDSDRVAHELFEPGQDVHDRVVQTFGDRILATDGRIDRRILGNIVFHDPEARTTLNSLVHPAIIRRQQEWLSEMEFQDPDGIAIVDAALMIEIGTYKSYQKVIVVTCDAAIQKKRLMHRTGLSEEQVDERIRAQMPLEEKVKYADFVINTSGDLAHTRLQVEDVNSRIRESGGSTSGSSRS
jgi:dephospho-CoA kinase